MAVGTAVARQWRQLSRQDLVVSQKTRIGRESRSSPPEPVVLGLPATGRPETVELCTAFHCDALGQGQFRVGQVPVR